MFRRTVRLKLSAFSPRATSVVVPSSGVGKLRKVSIRGFMAFSKLGLSDKVIAAVKTAGYTTPTAIQEQAIPHVLSRRDVLGEELRGAPAVRDDRHALHELLGEHAERR